MTDSINLDAVIGLAVSTAILRADFDNQTTAIEIEEAEAWDDIAKQAIDYIKWVGLDTSTLKINKYVIAKCFWGMDEDTLNEELSSS